VPSTKQRRRLEYEEARKGRPKLVPEKPSPYQAKGLQNEGGPYQYQNQYQYENHTRAVGEEIEDGNVSQMRLLLRLSADPPVRAGRRGPLRRVVAGVGQGGRHAHVPAGSGEALTATTVPLAIPFHSRYNTQ
jgi:hypothetical protein